MRVRALFVAALLLVSGLPSQSAGPEPAALVVPSVTMADLMSRYGLDTLFAQFGRTIAGSPRSSGVADETFLRTWERVSLDVFAGDALNRALAARLSSALDPGDIDALAGFNGSDFGRMIGALEHETQSASADGQMALVAKGELLYFGASESRRAQFDELLDLTGAEMIYAVLRESIRGMALGLRMSGIGGDIRPEWRDIDADVERQLAGMRDSLRDATLGLMAHTYASLSDDELEDYLVFLREPSARKFYAAATLAIGEILSDTMLRLGRDVAAKLRAVQI